MVSAQVGISALIFAFSFAANFNAGHELISAV